MSSVFKNSKITSIAKSGWIDELSDEEEAVLKHSAAIDDYMKSGKADKKIKIGLLQDIGVKD